MTLEFSAIRVKLYGFAFGGVGFDSVNPDVALMVAKIYTDANVVPLTKARFRPTLDQVGLDDQGGLLANEADRACSVVFSDVGDFAAPRNSRQASAKFTATCTITNAVVRGSGNEGHVVAWTAAEHADAGRSNAVRYPTDRALSDANTLALVLGFDALTQGNDSDEPRINNIHRNGISRLVPAGGSVLLCETSYTIVYRLNALASHAP
jgi:hypothetical protein